jgi:ribosome-interacting GTPase 1
MPANLPPQYFEAEKRYKGAKTAEGKVEALEEMLMIMPKHKGTDKLRADLRRKISKFKAQQQHKKGVSRREMAYSIEREGAGQIVLVGPPNTGKSSLVATLTNANPEVAEFPHSTWKPTPGMAPFENIQFQLVDTPPISREYVDPWMADLIRRCDMVAVVLDLHKDPLEEFTETMSVLQGLRIFPQGHAIPEALKKPPFVKKCLVVVNKVDEIKDQEDYEIFVELFESTVPCVGISSQTGRNLSGFLRAFYQLAGIIRVFTRVPGRKPDLENPFILPQGSTLEELAARIHKDFLRNLKFARMWGEAVYDGQMVQRDYVLRDGDIVEIHA